MLLTSASGVAFYFVGIFHTKDAAQLLQLRVHLRGPPPFGVLSIGRRPMRLRGERVRFASSLTVLGRPASDEPLLGVSYGVDDSAARFAALPLSVLLADQQDVTGQRVANSSTTFAPFRLWLAHECRWGSDHRRGRLRARRTRGRRFRPVRSSTAWGSTRRRSTSRLPNMRKIAGRPAFRRRAIISPGRHRTKFAGSSNGPALPPCPGAVSGHFSSRLRLRNRI